MKKRYLIFLLVLLIGIMVFMAITPLKKIPMPTTQFIPQSASANDIEYSYENYRPYSNYSSMVNDTVNLRHNNLVSDNYSATWDFLNEAIGTTNAAIEMINRTDMGSGLQNIIIQSGYDKHNKIMSLVDTGAGAGKAYNYFTQNRTNGVIEFWANSNDVSNDQRITFYDSGTAAFYFQFYNNKITGTSGAIKTVYDNTWYHIRIVFECGAGHFQGLAADTFYIYVNKERFGAFSFGNPAAEIDYLMVFTGNAVSATLRTDAFGYSWEGYNNYSNYNPLITNVSNLVLSPDKYEFTLDSNNVANLDGATSVFGWNTVGVVPATTVNIDNDDIAGLDHSNYGVKVVSELEGGNCGIENTTLGLNGDDINFSFGIRFIDTTETTSDIRVHLNSSSNDCILGLKFETQTTYKTQLEYWDGAAYQNLVMIYGISNPLNLFEFNAYLLNYTIILRFFFNDVFNSSYSFDYAKMQMNIDSAAIYGGRDHLGDSFDFKIESVGIYQYNCSICKERGYLNYYFGSEWDFSESNLFSMYTLENCRIIGHNERFYYDNDPAPYPYTIHIRNYQNGSWFSNFVDSANDLATNASLSLIASWEISPSLVSFAIEGVSLRRNSSIYLPTYTYSNLVKNISYFYVSGHRGYYTAYFNKTSTLEYMQMVFDIADLSTVNRSINFLNKYNGVGSASFSLIYNGGSLNEWAFSFYTNQISQILPQGYLIDTFKYLITDNNISGYSFQTTSGYMGGITFQYVPDLENTILTLNLMDGLIPFLITFFPSIALYIPLKKKGQDNYARVVFVGMFLFLTLALFGSGLIPLWALFVLIYALGFFFLISRRRDNL